MPIKAWASFCLIPVTCIWASPLIIPSFFMRALPLFYSIACLVFSIHCLQNVTVDDNDSSIQYIGQWSQSDPNDLDYEGSHAYTTNSTSEAYVNFTGQYSWILESDPKCNSPEGVAVYFLSPLWPYAVSTALTLDSRPTNIVDLTDYDSPLTTGGGSETVRSAVVWSAENLSNMTHTLRISVGRGQQNTIVDGLM